METRAKNLANLFKVLANENRILILCALNKCSMNVGNIMDYIPSNITPSALSQHLNILKANNILTSTKIGQNVVYEINDDRILKLFATIREQYCCDDN